MKLGGIILLARMFASIASTFRSPPWTPPSHGSDRFKMDARAIRHAKLKRRRK